MLRSMSLSCAVVSLCAGLVLPSSVSARVLTCPEPNIDVVGAFYAALEAGNYTEAAIAPLVNATLVQWIVPGNASVVPYAGTYYGVDGIIDFLQRLNNTVTLLKFIPLEFVCSDGLDTDVVHVVRFVYERCQVKSNGAQYDNDFAVKFTTQQQPEVRIVQMQNYMDTALIQAAFQTPTNDW